MITDEDRREVARKLREFGRYVFHPDNIMELLASAMGIEDFDGTDDLFNRLANLIEPEPERTCHAICVDREDENGVLHKMFHRCSFCGHDLPYEAEKGHCNYCPHCGSKVVDDGRS